jgi:hypothetical protein
MRGQLGKPRLFSPIGAGAPPADCRKAPLRWHAAHSIREQTWALIRVS